ncbi:MAG: glycosyltransferase family A protein [Actinomycetota bacterium]
MVTVSVVVPATDRPDTLGRCLRAVDAGIDTPDESIVVDGPADLSAAAARNHGARRATGDVVLFIDADVEVHADAIARVRRTMSERPDLTAVFGSYDDAPDDRSTVSAFRNLLHHHVHHHGAGPAETFWTGLGAIRRERFLTSGGFDEARFPHPSVEDVDLGMRLAADGDELLLDPTIQGTHLKSWTLRSMLETDLFRRGVPWVALMVRDRRAPTGLNLGWAHRLSALASIAMVVGACWRRTSVVVVALGALVALNRRFYALLTRRLGPLAALAGIALHVLHHLASVASVPIGLAVGALEARRPEIDG